MKRTVTHIAVVAVIVATLGFGAVVGSWHVHIRHRTPTIPVTFRSDVELAGTLVLPKAKGPFPAVIVVHGSGPQTRDQIAFRIHANHFAQAGIATLIYDKRGVGESGGTFVHGDYRHLVADVHAGLDFLKSHPEIDPDRLGYNGHSEGGLLFPLVASERDDLRFAYLRVAPLDGYRSVARYEEGLRLERLGYPRDEVDSLVTLMVDVLEFYAAAGDDSTAFRGPARERLETRLDAAHARYGGQLLPFPRRLPDDYDGAVFRRIAFSLRYDPASLLASRVDVPSLWVFGGRDESIHTPSTVSILERIREDAGKDVQLYVYEGEDHSLSKRLRFLWGTYPPGYFERVLDFMREHAGLGAR